MDKEVWMKNLLLGQRTEIPEKPDYFISREKLVDILKRENRDMIVFQAGAGFGKTEIMAEWAKKTKKFCCWYRMDVSDNNPEFFLEGLQFSFFKMEDNVIPKNLNMEKRCQGFIEYIGGILKDPAVYFFLDNFQVIKNRAVYKLIEKLLNYKKGGIRFVLATRGSIPDFFASLLLRGKIKVIGEQELRFEKREISLIISRISGKKPQEHIVDDIQKYTLGWPVGVIFTGRSLTFPAEKGLSIYHNRMHLYSYIFYEIFQKLPEKIQNFLMDASILEELNTFICDEVLKTNNSKRILEYLVKENFFVYQAEREENKYYFHPVFREFLKNRVPVERKERVLLQEAGYYARRGRWEKSVSCAVQCGEKGENIVSEVFEGHSQELLNTAGDKKISEWINYLYGRKDRLRETVLFAFYKILRCQEKKKMAQDILHNAAEKAYENGHYETYAEYMYEYVKYTEGTYGIVMAEETAAEAGNRLAGKPTSYCSRIILFRLECRLQMEDYAQLRLFLKTSENPDRRRLYHLDEIRQMVRWALELNEECRDWESIKEKAEFTIRLSKVYAEYGFYRSIWILYKQGDKKWKELAEEAIQIDGKSSFGYWIRMLFFLEKYKREKKEEIAGEIKKIEEYRMKMGMDFPWLSEEDYGLLGRLLSGEWNKNVRENRKDKKFLLEVKCLGSFSVKGVRNEIVWRTRKTKELFACLFFEEGRGVTKDILLERLWPEADLKKATTLLHTTISYLRKALLQAEAREVLKVKNQTYALDMQHIKSDFSNLMQWKQTAKKGIADQTDNIMEVTELYHGCYMQGEDYLWLGGQREYVEQVYLQTLKKLAERQMESENYEEAALLLQKAIEVDNFAVSLIEMLIKCYILAGDFKEAKRQYSKLKKICVEELGQNLTLKFKDYVKKLEDKKEI